MGAAQGVHPRGLGGCPPPGLSLFCLAHEYWTQGPLPQITRSSCVLHFHTDDSSTKVDMKEPYETEASTL